jgi:HSP20 family protein
MQTCNSTKYLRPASTVIEKPEGYLIEADLPGVPREGIQLTIEDDALTILGKRGEKTAGTRQLHRETAAFDFRRSFELGREVERQGVTARFENGVLQVFLPKSEALKPRRIEVAG